MALLYESGEGSKCRGTPRKSWRQYKRSDRPGSRAVHSVMPRVQLHSACSGRTVICFAPDSRSNSITALTVSSRANACISEEEPPQIRWQNLLVGPSKSQCDAPPSTIERSNAGTARAIERPLPYRLQPEGSASSTTAGELSCDAA